MRTQPGEKGGSFDSIIFRYEREEGFKKSRAIEEEFRLNPLAHTARDACVASAYIKRHEYAVSTFGRVECFVLEVCPEDGWAQYLGTVKAELEKPAESRVKLEFKAPGPMLVMLWSCVMRGEKDKNNNDLLKLHNEQLDESDMVSGYNKAASIKTTLAKLSGTYPYFGAAQDAHKSMDLTGAMMRWKQVDTEISADSFDIATDMSKCWMGLVTSSWSNGDQLRYWSMLLVTISIFGRVSCMTTHAPIWETVELPVDPGEWDKDGLPKWIEIALLNWKSRRASRVGHRYGMKLFRNYLDPRFCPVTFLILWQRYSGLTTGKLWGNVTHAMWKGRLMTMLQNFMGKPNLSGHSPRRTAAEWAGRCGDKGLGTRNAGRWKSWVTMMRYVGQGTSIADSYATTVDPIFKTWVFKPITSAGVGNQDDM